MANANQRAGAVHLLADHLDAILAAGEDLIGLSFDPGGMLANGVAASAATTPETITAEQFVRQISTLELAATVRVIAARSRTEELMEIDDRFEQIARLFLGGTVALIDAAERVGVSASTRGAAADIDAVNYLRTRGVIGETDAGLPDFDPVEISEDFRLCGIAELSGLMDMTASFLDALEIHYELFPNDVQDVDAPVEIVAAEPQETTTPKLN